jgi:iron(III) transport system substrate-binding protein
VNADVLVTYTSDLALVYARENVTAPYSSAVTAELDDEVESENFMAIYQYPVVPQYNKNLVSEDDMAASYEELADPKWKGKVGLVRGDGNWYFTLFDYLTTEKGMSVEEFEEIFSGIAANSRAFEGHGTASLVAAGEVPMLLNGFQLFTLNLAEENAPISSEPPIEPVAMLQFGAGMTTTAENPACAVLFSEWAITDGQKQVVDYNYYPVNFQALDEELPFSVEDRELAHMPVDSLTAEQFSEWEAAFENLVSGKENILPEYVR